MADAESSTKDEAMEVEGSAPVKKKVRGPYKKRDKHGDVNEQQQPEAGPSMIATKIARRPKQSLASKSHQKEAKARNEEGHIEQEVDELSMSVDKGERATDAAEASISRANLFEQNNGSRTPVESLPETSMLLESSSKRAVRQHRSGALRSATTAMNEPLSADIAKAVEDLCTPDEYGFQTLKDGAEAEYTFKHSSTASSSSCYMGPIQSHMLQSVAVDASKTLANLVDDAKKPGALLNAGGHIYSIDWLPTGEDKLQYICVSASLEKNPRTMFGEKLVSERKPARLQIWSIDETYVARLCLVLCFDQGWISTVRWVPVSSVYEESTSTLGLLSACMQDGSVGIYAVPRLSSRSQHRDGGIHIKVEPLIQLNVKKGVPTAMEWFNADKVAVAYSDGCVSVWSLLSCLQAGTRKARPLTFTRLSTSTITSLAWHSNGEQIFVSSFDGSMRCLQLAQPQLSTTLYHSRDVSYSVMFSHVMGFPLMERPEFDDVRSVEFSAGKAQTTSLYSHLGRIRAMDASLQHTLIASGSADGTLKVVDMDDFLTRGGKKARKAAKNAIIVPVYRLDKNRGKPALRFIENLAAQTSTQNPAHSSAAWDPEISLTAVKWNPNLDRQSWIASAMACGLIRVDVVDM